jgi:hypothetical protein
VLDLYAREWKCKPLKDDEFLQELENLPSITARPWILASSGESVGNLNGQRWV